MNGAALAARYAFPPNSLGYCGSRTFPGALRDNSSSGSTAILEKELKKFRVHYGYLRLIAEENGLRPFDVPVVRAFWTGNQLLGNVSPRAMRAFIRKELFGGKRSARAESLARSLPEGILPHHSFNSLYVNFVTGKVSPSVKNLDSCCITWGKVLSARHDAAIIRRNCIAWEGGFTLAERDEKVSLARGGIRFVGAVEKGDVLAVHWGVAVEKLAPSDARALRKYTLINIRALRRR